MVYIVCLAFLLAGLLLVVDRGTAKNIGRLILILLSLIAFALYVVWQLVKKAG